MTVLISELKEILPNYDLSRQGLFDQSHFSCIEPKMMNLLSEFEQERVEFIQKLDEAGIKNLIERKDELKSNLTASQLIFLQSLLVRNTKDTQNDELYIDILKFVVEPDKTFISDRRFLDIKNEIEMNVVEIPENQLSFIYHPKSRVSQIIFRVASTLAGHVIIFITQDEISGNRLIMLKYFHLDKMKPEFQPKLQKFEELMDQSFQPRHSIETFPKFLEIKNTRDDFYLDLIREINLLYAHELPRSLWVMVRKLFENLLIEILRKKYGPQSLDLYYREAQGRHHDFNVLLENFKVRITDFKPIAPELDINLIAPLDKFRARGGSAAHSLINKPSLDDITSSQEKIGFLARLFFRILEQIAINEFPRRREDIKQQEDSKPRIQTEISSKKQKKTTITLPADYFTRKIRTKSSKKKPIPLNEKILIDIADSNIDLSMREKMFTNFHTEVVADKYDLKSLITNLIEFFLRLKSSDSLEDRFYRVLALDKFYRDIEVKEMVLDFWKAKKLTTKLLDNMSGYATNRDIRIKLESQTNIFFSIYSDDFNQLKLFFKEIVKKADNRRFKSFLKLGNFNRISPHCIKQLIEYFIDLAKDPEYEQEMKEKIHQLYVKLISLD